MGFGPLLFGVVERALFDCHCLVGGSADVVGHVRELYGGVWWVAPCAGVERESQIDGSSSKIIATGEPRITAPKRLTRKFQSCHRTSCNI